MSTKTIPYTSLYCVSCDDACACLGLHPRYNHVSDMIEKACFGRWSLHLSSVWKALLPDAPKLGPKTNVNDLFGYGGVPPDLRCNESEQVTAVTSTSGHPISAWKSLSTSYLQVTGRDAVAQRRFALAVAIMMMRARITSCDWRKGVRWIWFWR